MKITVTIPAITVTIDVPRRSDRLSPDPSDDPLVYAVVRFARERRAWKGSATALLDELNQSRGNRPAEQGWPTHFTDLGRRLRRAAPLLDSHGVVVRRGKADGTRSWSITWATKEAA